MESESTTNRYARLSDAKRRLLQERIKKTAGQKPASNLFLGRPESCPPLASHGQLGIWLTEKLDTQSSAYNIVSCYDFTKPLDERRVELALNQIIDRHEALKSRFEWVENRMVYTLDTQATHNVEAERSCNIEERTAAHADTLFDLETGPLLKLVLLSNPEGEARIILVVHHIVFDEWSLGIFWREFQDFYNAAEKRPNLSPVSQFYDFSHWHRNEVEKGSYQTQLAYWREHLRDAPAATELPFDSFGNRHTSNSGRIANDSIGATLSRDIRDLSTRCDATLFSTLLATFSLLLSKYTECDDIVVGTPVANRRDSSLSGAIGYFLNTLAIRSKPLPELELGDYISQTHTSVLSALDNQDVPFDLVIDAVRPERKKGKAPLIQTMFVLQNEQDSRPPLVLDGETLCPADRHASSAKMDLTFFVNAREDDFELFIEYKTQLLTEGTVRKILRHFKTLLHSAVHDPRQRLSEINILPKEEERQLIRSSRGETLDLSGAQPLPERITHQSRVTPSATAIVTESEKLDYEELEKRVQSLAAVLANTCSDASAPVAIYLPRSAEAIVSILSILRIGSYYVALDPRYPLQRNRQILNDAAPSVIVTSEEFETDLGKMTGATVVASTAKQNTHQAAAIDKSQLAYLIYTSGSTGTPKGVTITHENLIYSTEVRTTIYERTPKRFLMLSSLSFDSSVAGIFWTLSTGGTLILPNPGDEQDPEAIRNIISKNEVTSLLCVPSLYREIISSDTRRLKSLELAIVAGEDCPSSLVDIHYETIPKTSLYNEYGPTEASVWSTVKKLTKGNSATIGRPIPNYETYVLNRAGKLIPDQAVGELHIAGPGLAKGYFNNSNLTKERFPILDLGDNCPQRLYKTGDRVRRNSDGDLEILGRTDEQVKIRGFRLELGEVESAILAQDEISQAAVVHLTETLSGRQLEKLVAFVVFAGDEDRNTKKLRKSLASMLPAHAIPSIFVILESIPRLPNGKVDKKTLSKTSLDSNDPETAVAPRTANESKVLEIWKEVLSLPDISTTDSFFDLGGNSIQAIWLSSKIRDELHVKISPSQLLHSPNIIALAKLVEKEKGKTVNLRNIVRLQDGSDRPALFLVHAAGQELLFYKTLVEKLDKRIPIYGIQPIGHDGSEAPIEDIPTIIDRYIDEMLTVQPEGPFHVVGHCQGGSFAMEISKRLRSLGKSVGFICSIDGRAPHTLESKKMHHEKILTSGPNRYISYLIKIRAGIRWRIRRKVTRMKFHFFVKFGNTERRTQAIYRDSFLAISNGLNRHITSNFDHDILVLQCKDSSRYPQHGRKFWEATAPLAKFKVFDCLHHEILEEPHVRETAKLIAEKYFEYNK